jgi:hypothetical protein
MSDERLNDPVTEWIARHQKELSKHAGKYVGLEHIGTGSNNYQIVTSGSTSTELVSKVQQIDPSIKLIKLKVPPEGLSI